MECLIITVSNEPKRRFGKRRIRCQRLTYNNHSGGANVLILPYTYTELCKMSERRLFSKLKKLSGEISGKSVCCYADKRIEDIAYMLGARRCDGYRVIIDLIDILVRKAAKNIGADLTQIGVYDYAFGDSTAEVISNLSTCCNNVSLYTHNVDKALKSVHRIYDDTGMPIIVTDNYADWAKHRKIAVFMSDFAQNCEKPQMLALDVFGVISDSRVKKITQIKFDLCNDFDDIFALTDQSPTQNTVQFILDTGAELKLGYDIKIVGYE